MKLRKLLEAYGFEYRLLHTGQHFDPNMSAIFFEQLKLGKPEYHLGIGGGSNNELVGTIIQKTDAVLNEYQPDLVVVPGDVNSTFACAYAAASRDIPVAHIESGLRSFDMTMPEERNRILTDHISKVLFVTEPAGVANLKKEGIAEEKIHLVGNTIVDALLEIMPLIDGSKVMDEIGAVKPLCVFTFHRPVNVDSKEALTKVVEIVRVVSKKMKAVFPVHPRTKKRMEEWGLVDKLQSPDIILTEPQGYIDFLKLIKESDCVVSDSGGIQIETSYLGVPCFTVRATTELRITLDEGTNTLVNLNPSQVSDLIFQSLNREHKAGKGIPHWDGKASERIAEGISRLLS